MRPMKDTTTTRRRPRGSGSEWKDEKGVWHARKEVERNPRTGKRRLVEARAATKTEARNKLNAKIERMQREGGLPLNDVPTLDVWLDRWLQQTVNNVKPRTLEAYRSDCKAIRGVIGGMRLDKITAGDIERMCAQLGQGRSGKTVHNYFIRLQQALNAAVREKLIPANPALAAIPPRYEPSETRILDAGQPQRAIAAARNPAKRKYGHLADTDADREMWALMFDLAFETGMRQAERFALTPESLVTINGIHGIQVNWELQRLAPDATIPNWLQARHLQGRFWLLPPKSRQGRRFIPVNNDTWIRLCERAVNLKPDQLIFTRAGHPLTNLVERKRWRFALEDAGLPYVTMRSARHFFSTHLAEAGAPEDARKAMMGHAKITTTAGYTHWSAERLAALADQAREAIGQSA